MELVITCVNAADNTGGHFHSAGARVFNVFWYFTIQSNVIVGVTCLLLALRPQITSTVFAVFRLIGVVAITVTFVVFHVALSHLLDLDTWEQIANQLQHTVVPIVAVAGWLLFGPRHLTSSRIAAWTVLFPIVYMIATAIRGPLVRDWYPYPFADVAAHGTCACSSTASSSPCSSGSSPPARRGSTVVFPSGEHCHSSATTSATTRCRLAGLHVLWGLGSTFPFADRDGLNNSVVGRTSTPPPSACFAVAGALTTAACLVADVPRLPRGSSGSASPVSRSCWRHVPARVLRPHRRGVAGECVATLPAHSTGACTRRSASPSRCIGACCSSASTAEGEREQHPHQLVALFVELVRRGVIEGHRLEQLLVEREPAHHVVEEAADPLDLGVGKVRAQTARTKRGDLLDDAHAHRLQRDPGRLGGRGIVAEIEDHLHVREELGTAVVDPQHVDEGTDPLPRPCRR